MAKAPKSEGKMVTAKFQFKRSTKGTHVYEEVDDKGEPARNIVGSLYVQRSATGNDAPATCEATFKFA